MQYTTSKSQAETALLYAASFTSNRGYAPTASVLIEAMDGVIRFSATNLDASIQMAMAGAPVSTGSALVPAAKLLQIVKQLPSETIEFSLQKDKLVVSSGGSSFKLNCLPARDYPSQGDLELPAPYQVDSTSLIDSIHRVSHAASTDKNRYSLNGIFIELSTEALVMTATDGRRLSHTKILDGAYDGKNISAIIPRDFLSPLSKCLGLSATAEVYFDSSMRSIFVQMKGFAADSGITNLTVRSKLVDGKFPNYKNVLPHLENGFSRLKVDRSSLLEVIKRAALVYAGAKDESPSIKFETTDQILELSGTSSNFGISMESIEFSGECPSIATAANSQYVSETLRNSPFDEISLHLKDSTSPIVITSGETIEVIMPLRLS